MNILELKDCFLSPDVRMSSSVYFLKFLSGSNHPEIEATRKEGKSVTKKCKEIEVSVLKEILDILLKEPEANYFWYTWSSQGILSYSLPKDEQFPSNSLMIDGEKIKSFLINYKISSILE
jgi:hypothetical protein